MRWSDLKNKLLASAILGVVIIAALAIYADLPRTVAALQRFVWHWLPLILLLTLCNYGLRFVKWHYYLGQIGAQGVSLGDSARIFVAGFTMVMTPGKVGELYKALALKQTNNVPVSRAAPVVLAERLTDGLAMVFLASTGLALYGYGTGILLGVLAAMAALIIGIQIRPLALWVLATGERLPIVSRFAHALREFYESAYRLLSLRNLLFAVTLGVVSWGAEGVALYLVLVGLGLEATPELLVQAVSALASSTILGAISLLPGGLGVIDGSLTGLLLLLTRTTPETAVAATLLIRFATLWFGVALGAATLLIYRKQLLPAPGQQAVGSRQ
jgi:uncharacterized protein (TIRG00374 family)